MVLDIHFAVSGSSETPECRWCYTCNALIAVPGHSYPERPTHISSRQVNQAVQKSLGWQFLLSYSIGLRAPNLQHNGQYLRPAERKIRCSQRGGLFATTHRREVRLVTAAGVLEACSPWLRIQLSVKPACHNDRRNRLGQYTLVQDVNQGVAA